MKRILFVDDENRILDGIRRMMYTERQRWNMEFASGGEAALKLLEAGSFDVVVSDMRMPGMDGSALLSRVRESWPATVRVILSGHAELEAALRAVPIAHRFLVKPCDSSVLRETIERACTLQDLLGSAEIRRLVSEIGELPSLPRTYTALTEVIVDPNVTIERVAKIVEQDMAMSAKILQLANNAFFGATQTVTTMLGAVNYLGINTIKNLILTMDVFRVFLPHQYISASVRDRLQRHVLQAALLVEKLPIDRNIRDVTILGALLHDIGELVLATRMPEQFLIILDTAQKRHCRTFIVEEELLGTSHAEIGAYLLGLWGLPDVLVEAIAHHHHPTRIQHQGLDISLAVYLVDLLALESESPSLGLDEADQQCLEALDLTARYGEWRQLILN